MSAERPDDTSRVADPSDDQNPAPEAIEITADDVAEIDAEPEVNPETAAAAAAKAAVAAAEAADVAAKAAAAAAAAAAEAANGREESDHAISPDEPNPAPAVPKPLAPPSAADEKDGDGDEQEQEDEQAEEDAGAGDTAAGGTPIFAIPPPPVDRPEKPVPPHGIAGETAKESELDENLAYMEGEDPLDHIDEKVAEEEELVKKIRFRDRVSSITIAGLAHAVIFFLLTVFIIYGPIPDKPEIMAIAAPDGTQSDDIKKTVQRVYTKSKPSAKMTQLVTAASFSSVAVPYVEVPPPEDMTVGLGTEDFGLGFDAFQDGGFIASLPAAMQGRCTLVDRLARLTESGGKRKCEDAVHNALVWLHENQNDNGSWGKGSYPVAMTGLALLAYLGHCETPDSPGFSDTVVNAATFLITTGMQNKGQMVSNGGKLAYEHAIATYSLCELFTMTRKGKAKIPGLRELISDAVKIIIDGQNPSGGWNYGYKKGERNDTSVGGWQIQALRAAQNTKIEFSGFESAFDKSIKHIKRCQGEFGGFGYTSAEDKISLTGVGVLALQFAGEGDGSEAQTGLEYIMDQRKSLSYGTANFYEWYYTAQACFLEGGKIWDTWNDMFLDELLDAQNRDGSFPKGRGDREDQQTHGDGEIYRTCLCTLMLEVYYRYLPTTAK